MHRPVGTDSYRHVERWFLTSFPTTPAGTSNVLTRRACTGAEEAPDVISVRGFFLCVGRSVVASRWGRGQWVGGPSRCQRTVALHRPTSAQSEVQYGSTTPIPAEPRAAAGSPDPSAGGCARLAC